MKSWPLGTETIVQLKSRQCPLESVNVLTPVEKIDTDVGDTDGTKVGLKLGVIVGDVGRKVGDAEGEVGSDVG